VAAFIGAIALGFVIPLLGQRSHVDDPLVGPGEVVGAQGSSSAVATDMPAQPTAAQPTAVQPTDAPPAAWVDPGRDDVRESRAVHLAMAPLPPSVLIGYVWPIPKSRLTQPFGETRFGGAVYAGEPFHDGLDLATFCGDRIVAAHAGTVLAVGRRFDAWIGWRGSLDRYQLRLTRKHLWKALPIVVVIDDGNGYRSIYAHFARTTVKRGQVVKAGQLIGYEGRSGHASGCHLHYGLFSPAETRTFEVDPKAVKQMLLPRRQVLRIDPLLVLPHRKDLDLD
jgi:murein DD-endopeptidase MepM/ murein hydrolase activator NlpD